MAARKQRPLKLSLGTYRAGERLTGETRADEVYRVYPGLQFFGITRREGDVLRLKNVISEVFDHEIGTDNVFLPSLKEVLGLIGSL